jgi:hypothetical protein
MKRIFLPCLVLCMASVSAQVGTGNVGINTSTPEKTLDVNGDFRSSKTDTSTNTQYLLETNTTLAPEYNIAGVINPSDGTGSIFAQTKNISSFNTGTSDGGAALDLINIPGYSVAMLTNSNGSLNSNMTASQGGFSMSSQDTSTGVYTSFTVPNSIYLGPYFMYKDNTGTTTGEYYLPRNYGLRGQVLVTHGKSTAPGNIPGTPNDLVWRDVADLIVLKSPGGNCYKITVTDAGVLGTTPDADCMVDPYNPATYSNTSRMASGNNTRTTTSPEKIMEEQKKQIEEIQKQMNEIRNKLTQKNKTKSTQ